MKTKNKIRTLVIFIFVIFSANAIDHPLNQQSGSFSIAGSSYIDNMNEVYYINTGVNKPVALDFCIDTEDGYDYVDIYSIDSNGTESTSPIASYTGYIEGGYLSTVIPSGRVKVVFYSDGSVNNNDGYYGFDMSFSVDNSFTSSVNSYTSGNSYVNGSLGIGTNMPREKLDVNGSTIINDRLGIGTQTYSGYKVRLWNTTDTYSIYSYTNKNTTSSVYGLYSYAYNPSGNVYGIYSNVSGATGKKWAGYFTGGDVAVTEGTLKADEFIIGKGNRQFYFHTQTWKTTDPPIIILAPKLNSTEWDWSKQIIFNSEGSILMSAGKLGVGTPTPTNKFEVVGSNANYFEAAGFYNNYTYGNTDKAETRINIGKIENNTTREPMGAIGAFPTSNYDSNNGNLVFYTRNTQNMVERVRISKDGNVLIGTTLPDPTNALLTVNGTIHAKEINVTVDIPADYVFHPSYNLMPLNQVEQFVKINNHLPEIPSAAEITKNGLSVGEMQNKLLQKIEELTLYVIEQQKQIEELKAELKKK